MRSAPEVSATPGLSAKTRHSDLQRLQRTIGNRALGRLVGGGRRLPSGLQAGAERLAGVSLDDVTVHYGSRLPQKLHARAYAAGSEIHLAPGEERHLPHEAWHVAQQKQGRVPALSDVGGVSFNGDPVLEREAETMGSRALALGPAPGGTADASPLRAKKGAPGAPVVQAVLVLSHTAGGTQRIDQGLIRGGYEAHGNTADLHVDAKSAGPGLSVRDMLDVAEGLHTVMKLRERAGGPVGTFLLHPTGAAIVKIIVEMLGESLGGTWGWLQANALQKLRSKPVNPSPDKLAAEVVPEHVAYLESLRGSGQVKIVPRISAVQDAYKLTPGTDTEREAEASQDMMAETPEGNARFQKYKLHAQDQAEPVGASLDVTLTANELPAIIKTLRKRA